MYKIINKEKVGNNTNKNPDENINNTPNKGDNTNQNTVIEEKDNTIANNSIPQTGESYIVIGVITAIALISIIFYIRFNKYKEIK